MDWVHRMNEAVDYVEANLAGEVNPAKAGRLAGCSAYHFQRVFGYMAGTTLAEYVRRRRLTLAAFELQQGGQRVIDVALKYGYESPTAFTRAFAALHGVPPSEAASGAPLVAYPPLSFQITIKGVSAINYRIEQLGAFRIVGDKLHTTMDADRNSTEIPAFWGKAAASGLIPRLLPLMDTVPMGILAASVGDWTGPAEFDYYIGAASTKPAPEGLYELTVPACTWAIFECIGPMPGAIQALQKRIVSEWLPASGYDYAKAPDIEVYSDGDRAAPDYQSWVWLPVVKK